MGNIHLFDKKFRERFREISQERMVKITNRLLSLFDTPEFHFCRSTMHRYYFKYPKIHFDKETASGILSSFFEGGNFSIVDYSEKRLTREHKSFVTDESSVPEQSGLNWRAFVEELQNRYWAGVAGSGLEEFNFYKDRAPKNLKERVLSGELPVLIDGRPAENKYSFFDVNQTLKYYEKLFALVLPEYPLQKEVSNKKIRRYAKDIGNGLNLGFYVDYSALERELKNGYLEFPPLMIEAFSSRLTQPIPELDYLNGQTEQPIARIHPFYFMGYPVDTRVGNSSESSEELRKKLHFRFEVFAFYTRIYLEAIAEILIDCSSKQDN